MQVTFLYKSKDLYCTGLLTVEMAQKQSQTSIFVRQPRNI